MLLKVVSPKKEELSLPVASVALPGGLGEVTILPGHTALMSTLQVGILRYGAKDGEGGLAVNRGFFEVFEDNVTVLTETCEKREEIDVGRATASLNRAQDRLAKASSDSSIDVARAEYAMRRALARLSVAGSGK
jgi:F-type H+-transporting ATPase subunit epsilon